MVIKIVMQWFPSLSIRIIFKILQFLRVVEVAEKYIKWSFLNLTTKGVSKELYSILALHIYTIICPHFARIDITGLRKMLVICI